MNWDSIQQVIRIAAYVGGSAFFGKEIADGEMFTAAVGGLVSIGAFVWWWVWERNRA